MPLPIYVCGGAIEICQNSCKKHNCYKKIKLRSNVNYWKLNKTKTREIKKDLHLLFMYSKHNNATILAK